MDEYITTARAAEVNAARRMRSIGFPDAQPTALGADGGVDVTSSRAIGQVKWRGGQTGRPDLQRLYGARGADTHLQLFFFSASGFSQGAIDYANSVGMRLFTYDPVGVIDPANAAAFQYLNDLVDEEDAARQRQVLHPPEDRTDKAAMDQYYEKLNAQLDEQDAVLNRWIASQVEIHGPQFAVDWEKSRREGQKRDDFAMELWMERIYANNNDIEGTPHPTDAEIDEALARAAQSDLESFDTSPVTPPPSMIAPPTSAPDTSAKGKPEQVTARIGPLGWSSFPASLALLAWSAVSFVSSATSQGVWLAVASVIVFLVACLFLGRAMEKSERVSSKAAG